MYRSRNTLFGGALALSSFLALGAGAAGGAGGAATPHTSSAPNIVLGGAAPASTKLVELMKPATVHATTALVGSKSEKILVNAKGLPLYYYAADTAKKSFVSGGLAQLWPALVSSKPTATGVKGKLVSLKEVSGRQVAFKGHFLYTFVDDTPGHVNGQGVSDFFVATPSVKTIGSSHVVRATVSRSGGYGY
jgi:predicted lipoprotein with Yx(FWY)xxD motif